MALFKIIKQLESTLSELEQKKPSFFISKWFNDRKIKNIKARLDELNEEVIIRKNKKQIKPDYK